MANQSGSKLNSRCQSLLYPSSFLQLGLILLMIFSYGGKKAIFGNGSGPSFNSFVYVPSVAWLAVSVAGSIASFF